MKASKTTIWGLSILAAVCLAPDAKAQMANPKARDKVEWYHTPHELQIIDDRPIVKDFREPPTQPQGIQLPPAPQGFGAPGGGNGGGAMGDGGNPSNPAGGIPMQGNGGPAYRSDNPGMSSLPLPKSGFGRDSNIPAAGIVPRGGPLPSGVTTGIHGHLMTPTLRPTVTVVGGGAGAGNRAATAVHGTMQAANYGGNYTQAPPGGSASGAGASTAVRGVLLNRLLKP